jgi:hypothetical protein
VRVAAVVDSGYDSDDGDDSYDVDYDSDDGDYDSHDGVDSYDVDDGGERYAYVVDDDDEMIQMML